MLTIDASFLKPCRGVDPGHGPHSLPFEWRVLYEVVDLLDMFPATRVRQSDPQGPRYRPVSERELLGKMSAELGIKAAHRQMTYEAWLAGVEPAIRSKVRDAVQELAEAHAVIWEDTANPIDGWYVGVTAPGYLCVHQWRQRWIGAHEKLMAVRGFRPYVRRMFAAEQTVIVLAAVIGAIVGAVVTVVLLHLIH